MMNNFINYHVLISHSPSCLNRDDMNMQKSAIFGGKRRVRISSQSLKRTLRKSEYYREYLGEPSIRTKRLAEYQDYVIERLDGRYEADLVKEAVAYVSGNEKIVQDVKSDAVAPWVVEEIAFFCDQILELKDEGVDAKKLQKQVEKNSPALREAVSKSIDIALSGRMATSGLMSKVGMVDGALAVAHSITTHVVDADVDWFTAVDDLQELGSGHLDTQEFSSGVFYRYASLNIAMLQKNLGDASREKALEIAAHVLHLLTTEVPSAKQQSFAAHNLADQALVCFSSQPISLANAFEAPVLADREGGFRSPSAKKMNDHWLQLNKGYALKESCAEFSLDKIELPSGIEKKNSLPDLEAWVKNDGKQE